MAYYGYYQQQAPGWGSAAEYQPMPPPMPAYTPASNWGGYDYYQAHTGDTDRSLFDSIWGRFKSALGFSTQGYSRQHAKQLYRRIYGGMADLMEVPPEELGAAAGYEAVRIWEYHHNLYQAPLNHDLDREREALGGLAIGEANKLWGRANPYRQRHGRRICAEVAIATAERIFTFQYDQAAGVAPYLSPEQQIANRGLTRSALVQGPPYDTGFQPSYGSGRRSRRGSWSYYDQPGLAGGSGPPPVGAIPIGGRGMGTYQNAQGYSIADAPLMGDPYPQDIRRSPRIIPTGMGGVDPYDDPYIVPTGAPGSYGGGGAIYPTGAPGSYGGGGGVYPMGAAGSYGGGMGVPGPYGGGVGAPVYDGYEAPMLAAPSYRRQRSYSQGYRY
ncbi:hypothetical protein M408DRAFT_6928 [Serendipita vermifera MAFF 305830]|uniref:Uncharacterized protein n=1 Tax=Serendipita vermifera MAFF 305830 TaxID=933852 RepID=A0A0C3B524_SERVB|nr:hypothetical protein M408DRAFT_6928 [Serendipita vermifera MAFF 305830]